MRAHENKPHVTNLLRKRNFALERGSVVQEGLQDRKKCLRSRKPEIPVPLLKRNTFYLAQKKETLGPSTSSPIPDLDIT